jgi:fucose 4-O-acetylase-like acetyltransferase
LSNPIESVAQRPKTLWVEYAKAIGIILVVYGHVARGANAAGLYLDESGYHLIDSIIYSFHMPLFFFLSGLFFPTSLRKRGAGLFCANKVDTLLYPYVVWSLLQGSVEALLNNWTNGHATFLEVLELVWLPRAQLWFLYALLTVSLFGVLVSRLTAGALPLTVVLLAAAGFAVRGDNFGVPIFAYLLGYFVFFAAGACFAGSRLEAGLQQYRRMLLLPGIAAFCVAQYLYHLTFGLTYASDGIAGLGLALISIAMIVLICMCLADRTLPALATLGAASLGIYLLHILVGSGSRIVLMNVFRVHNLLLILSVGTLAGAFIPMALYTRAKQLGILSLFVVPTALSVENLLRAHRDRLSLRSTQS